MNLTYFRPKMRGNVENKNNNPVKIRFVDKTSDIINLPENITSDVMFNISQAATPVSMIPNFWCSLEVAAAELHLCFVIKGNLWWKRTFLPMVTIVVLHRKRMKLFKPLYTTCYCVVRQKTFKSVDS